MSARQRPRAFNRAASRMVATDSSRARSMNAHVLTMRHSASSGRSTSGKPASVSMPSISSESTWFLGHPSVVRWTFIGNPKYTPQASGDDLHSEAAPVPLGRRRQDARRARVDPSRGDEKRHRVHDVVPRDRPGAERPSHPPCIEPRYEPPEAGETTRLAGYRLLRGTEPSPAPGQDREDDLGVGLTDEIGRAHV